MRSVLVLPAFICAAVLAASCVTINIYFPAAAAEKAADRIIEEVYQLRKDAPASPTANPAAANPAAAKPGDAK